MKKKLTEAQVNLSIADLSSSDLQTLSQILSLAGQAEQAAGLMGGMGGIGGMGAVGGMASDPMASDPLASDPMAGGGIDAPGGIGENGPLAMAGPDADYGMDSGLGLNAGADDGLGMDDGLGLGDGLGLDDGMGADMGTDMDLGMDDLAAGGDDLGLEGGDDMGADEFDLTMGDLGGTDIDDDAMVEESFNRLFALCGLNESEEAEDEEVIEEDESAMEGEEVISEEAEEDLDEASAPVIALDLNDPQMKQLVGDVDVPGTADHAGMSGFPAAGAAAKPEIQHSVPSAQTQHPGMAAPGEEEDSMDWLNVPSAGGPAPSTSVGSAGTQPQGMGNPAQQQGQLSPMGQPAKPTWMEEMSEDMDVFEEVEEDEESEELEEGQMFDFSLDEDAVEELKSPGLGDNRMFGPYANDREAANDARLECPAGVVGRDFQIIKRPNGVFWKKIVSEDVANSRPKLQDVCTSGIENSIHAIEKVPGKVGDNTLKFMEAQDIDTIHASLNEQFELFMKGKK